MLPCRSWSPQLLSGPRHVEKTREWHALEHRVSITLRGIVYIRIVQEFLDTEKHLGDSRVSVSAYSPYGFFGRTCLIVMAGFQDFSSSRIDRQTVPEGYTLGWNRGGVNLPGRKGVSVRGFAQWRANSHFGGLDG